MKNLTNNFNNLKKRIGKEMENKIRILAENLRGKRSYKEQEKWEQEVKNLSPINYKLYLIYFSAIK